MRPSTLSPSYSWKARIAISVSGPTMPFAGPGR